MVVSLMGYEVAHKVFAEPLSPIGRYQP